SIVKEPSVRGDVIALFANLEDALVVLRALMIAELSALRDGRPHVPRLEVPQRSDVPSVFRVLVAQDPRPPPRVVPLPSVPRRAAQPTLPLSSASLRDFGGRNVWRQPASEEPRRP